MDISKVTQIHDYVEGLRDQPVLVERGTDTQTTNSTNMQQIWDIVQSSATILEQLTKCCGCNLSSRITTNLTQLETLKNQFTDTLSNLNEALSNGSSTDSSVYTLVKNIQNRIQEIQASEFPECMNIIVDTCQDILSAIDLFDPELQAEIKNITDKILPLTQSIAQIIHSINVFSENFI